MIKLIRVSTIPSSLNILLKGQLAFLNQHFEVVGVSSAGPDLKEVAEREQITVKEIDIERKISPIKDVISLIKLYFYFKKECPQIVHSITPKAGLLSMMAAKFAGVPVRIHTFTGLIFPSHSGPMQKLLIMMDKLLCLCATTIYPEGEGVKKDLLAYNVTKKHLTVIGNGNVNGIDVEYFSPQKISVNEKDQLKNKLGITDNDFVFIFIGRLVGDKGINELIKAFKAIDNSKLLLVGPLEEKLDPLSDETLKEIDTNKNIIQVGFQKDVRPYLAISNALVFPSYREGFPNVPMQAGCFDLPSIVTDISGSNEIIKNGENGLIIPPQNINALKEAMEKMLANKPLYLKMKLNARKVIVDNYEQTYFWSLLLKEYQQHLKQNGIS